MGIPGLTRRLLHKGERVCWTSSDVDSGDKTSKIAIIDGPSFAHHVFHRLLQEEQEHHHLNFSYTVLNQALLARLAELKKVGFEM